MVSGDLTADNGEEYIIDDGVFVLVEYSFKCPDYADLEDFEKTKQEAKNKTEEALQKHEGYIGTQDKIRFQTNYDSYISKFLWHSKKEKIAADARQKAIVYFQSIPQTLEAPNFTSGQYYLYAKNKFEQRNAKPLVLDEFSMPVFEMLCHYFARDERFYECFEKYDILVSGRPSLDKGLAFFGPPGVGKTEMVRLFAENPMKSFLVFKSAFFPQVYKQDCEASLMRYLNPITNPSAPFGQSRAGLCIDDLGEETIASHYKSEIESVSHVLMGRWERTPKNETHFTTNMRYNPNKEGEREIEKRYGTRFYDRLRENMNLIRFPKGAGSRR